MLVERYVNLLRAGVDPDNILAITFTRKAAAEMRERIVERLREASRVSQIDAARWRDLASRLGDIAISTIDAFCLSLLREFPLEADVDPGFELADDTEVPAPDRGIARSGAAHLPRAGARRRGRRAGVRAAGRAPLRAGLAALLDRRLVAPDVLRRFLARWPARPDRRVRVPFGDRLACAIVLDDRARRHRGVSQRRPAGASAVRDARRRHPRPCVTGHRLDGSISRRARSRRPFARSCDRLRGYFLTQEGKPRGERFAGTPFERTHCASEIAWKRHRDAAASIAPPVAEIIPRSAATLNVVLSRGVWRIFAVALAQYQRTLDARALLDFSGRPRARGQAAEADGRVRAEPLPARSALSPRARRRVPGHQPGAMGAGGAARAQLGRRLRRVG